MGLFYITLVLWNASLIYDKRKNIKDIGHDHFCHLEKIKKLSKINTSLGCGTVCKS